MLSKVLALIIIGVVFNILPALASVGILHNGDAVGQATNIDFLGVATPTGQATRVINVASLLQPSTTGAVAVLTLDQDDVDYAMINFVGTEGPVATSSIPTDTTAGAAKYGAIKIQINGVTKYIRIYNGSD